MSNQVKHTAEPWHVGGNGTIIYDAEGWGIANATVFHLRQQNGESQANARRIVACVNACAGIDTVHLENYGLPDFAKQISSLVEQRDQMLAALEQTSKYIGDQKVPTFTDGKGKTHLVQQPDIRGYQNIMNTITAAIAAAKGGAA